MMPEGMNYPVVMFLVRFGGTIAAGLAVIPIVVGLCLVLVGWSWLWLLVSLGLGALIYLFAKSYAEIVAIIADMLLPR